MPNYIYNIPVAYTAEDNESHINKVVIQIKDCSQFGDVNNDCLGYNFNKCPNDDGYCQPYVEGDLIYNQFLIDANEYDTELSQFVLVDNNGIEHPTDAISFTMGKDAIRNNYTNVIIDTGSDFFPEITCWYLKVKLWDGMSFTDFIATEQYCIARCEEATLLVRGEYTQYDCDGNFYGDFSFTEAENTHIPQFRVRAVIEPDGYTFTETVNGTRRTKSQQREQFLFRTEKIPYFVAKQLAIAFNSKFLTIDDIHYDGALKLSKNFEEGSEWIIEETVFIDCDEINFTCVS